MSLKHVKNVERQIPEVRTEMSETHRQILRYMRTFLVANMNPDSVLVPLQNLGVLNVHGLDIIKSKETQDDRCRTLLNMLPMRGPNSFQFFIQALEVSGQTVVAETLKEQALNPQPTSHPQVQSSTRGNSGDDEVMDHSGRIPPAFTGGDSGSYKTESWNEPIPFISAKESSKILLYDKLIKERRKAPIYPTLIICNGDYESAFGKLDLPLNVTDKDRICETLEKCDVFQTSPTLQDMPKEGLLDCMKLFCSSLSYSDGLLTVIFSHASEDASTIYTGKNEVVNILKDIVKPIVNAEALVGKPKIFLFILTVPNYVRSLPSFYNNASRDCLYVILRNLPQNSSPQRQELISTFCECIQALGQNESSAKELMQRLMSVAGYNVDIVHTLRIDPI